MCVWEIITVGLGGMALNQHYNILGHNVTYDIYLDIIKTFLFPFLLWYHITYQESWNSSGIGVDHFIPSILNVTKFPFIT